MNTNPKAKRILIYGDSLTWGKIPGDPNRYDLETRFTGVIQNQLGNDYEIIEEGLRGRSVSGDNPYLPYRDGFATFPSVFLSHLPLDLVVILLGTNDTNNAMKKNANDIVLNLCKYKDIIPGLATSMEFETPKIMFVTPPMTNDKFWVINDWFDGSTLRMRGLAEEMKKLGAGNDCFLYDASNIVEASEIDGIHLSPESNILLGTQLAKFIKEIIS